jgi:hypothetical protein
MLRASKEDASSEIARLGAWGERRAATAYTKHEPACNVWDGRPKVKMAHFSFVHM